MNTARPFKNNVHWLTSRKRDDRFNEQNNRHIQATPDLMKRLSLESELNGHRGCVNCLEWNEKGTILASGSDDHDIILWNPFTRKKLRTLNTGHVGNIFSVKFLPRSNDSLIATCAGDNSVKLFDVSVNESLLDCCCHANRVKRLASTSDCPHIFWSAGEDGLILQFDLRQPHRCKNPKNIFINLSNQQIRAEAKCININPIRQELMAVGANDPYIRLYDRRMLESISKPTSPNMISYSGSGKSENSDCDSAEEVLSNDLSRNSFLSHPAPMKGCLAYLAPGHLQSKECKQGLFSTTYVTFSPDGTELLSNIGSEQIYLFNLFQPKKKFRFYKFKECLETHTTHSKLSSFVPLKDRRTSSLTSYQEILKEEARLALKEKRYSSTIDICNRLLATVKNDSGIHRIRAKALLERKWEGDKYLAMRDAAAAVLLKSDCFKAYPYLIDSLLLLGRLDEATECLDYITDKFPSNKSITQSLGKKIEEARMRMDSKRSVMMMRERRTGSLMRFNAFNYARRQSNTESDSESSSQRNSSSGFSSLEEYNENNMDISMNEALCNFSPLVHDIKEKDDLKKRLSALDFDARFCGHCNTTTDIKEANFFGGNGQFIVAGSDEGSFFIWEKKTTNIIKALRGDEQIVNCLQPHPDICMLATSGIDPIVKIWSPIGCTKNRDIENVESVATWNQKRMQIDPLEAMLMMIYRPGLP